MWLSAAPAPGKQHAQCRSSQQSSYCFFSIMDGDKTGFLSADYKNPYRICSNRASTAASLSFTLFVYADQ